MTQFYIAEAAKHSIISSAYFEASKAKSLRGAKSAAERGRVFQQTVAYVAVVRNGVMTVVASKYPGESWVDVE